MTTTGMFDPNWCDWHGLTHYDIVAEHCIKGEHCTSTDAACSASNSVNDHSKRCCICDEEIEE